MIEICAGTARLSKTIRAKGMRALAIDKSKSRGCGTDIMVLDLTVTNDLNLLLQIISAESDQSFPSFWPKAAHAFEIH